MKTYPVSLAGLDRRKTVVIGGGRVAERKVRALLEAGAGVAVISPVLVPGLSALAAEGSISVLQRNYQPGDLEGASLVIAATADPALNQAVWEEAERCGCLINVVDDPRHSSFILPAVVRRGDFTVAVSTGGASPALARRVREQLEARFGPEYGDFTRLLEELRGDLLASFNTEEARLAAALLLVDSDILRILKSSGYEAARRAALDKWSELVQAPPDRAIGIGTDGGLERKQAGKVYLVGAGPGDPELLTLRAVKCLGQADVVVHDRLINRCLFSFAPQAEWIDVGKEASHHPVPQEEINCILVEKARLGKTTVRLKGGDPFVFGRGGEEALALVEAGIPFEIVPGVTSAVAVPAYAGIPITHRGIACSAAIVTGHRADCAEDPESDWKRAARGADTLVFLMGVKNLPRIVEQALAAGRSPATPVALIEQGTCPDQKTVTGTLADIVDKAAEVRPPAVVVIGEVVRLRENLRWFD